jgi:hypothetical protein
MLLALAFALVPHTALAAPMRWGISVDYGMSRPTTRRPARTAARILSRLAELKRSGLDHVRVELPMRETEHIANDPDHPAVTFVRQLRALDLDVVAVVGVGSERALPASLKVSDPDYIAKVSRNVRDVAWRLSLLGVRDYQVENELNVAGLSTLPGLRWREGARWWDLGFKAELLTSLVRAVKSADPTARVNHNFYDGLSDPIVSPWPSGRPSLLDRLRGAARVAGAFLSHADAFHSALLTLSEPLDEVGLDRYPNYTLPIGVSRLFGLGGARALADRVRYLGETTGKPVRIAETGYESRSPFGHGAEGQTRYVDEVARAAARSGAVAFTYFRLNDYAQPRARFTLNLNRLVEPYFGLLDARLAPKEGRASLAGTGPRSGWEALKAVMSRETRSAGEP